MELKGESEFNKTRTIRLEKVVSGGFKLKFMCFIFNKALILKLDILMHILVDLGLPLVFLSCLCMYL